MKPSFYQMSFTDLVSFFKTQDLEISGASKLYNWHYKKKLPAPCEMRLAKASLEKILESFDFELPKIKQISESSDKTVKFLFELKDGATVESVLIPFYKKYSLCVSSQVGCGMNCSFCFTGTQGFKRHLATHEIVGQFLASWNWLKENRPDEVNISNLVFMGQGEPLHNFDAVQKSCEIFLSQHGCSIAGQKITVSTSGYLPGLVRWKKEMPGVNLALSLHSPFKEIRDELIPINRKFDLKDVLLEIESIPLAKKQFVTYEYLLIDKFNDYAKDAHALGELLAGKRAYINLIPFNPFPGSNYKKPDTEKVEAFKNVLDTYKIPTLIRTTKGDEVLAACGQLKT